MSNFMERVPPMREISRADLKAYNSATHSQSINGQRRETIRYHFGLLRFSPSDNRADCFAFNSRDERQAAILALCDASERDGFALTIS